MSDELIEDKCEICGRVVKTSMYEGGYGGMGYYNFKRILPYEEREIHVPEKSDRITILACLDCINKEPSLHSIILKKRKEWFKEEIINNRKHINHLHAEIKKLKEKIPNVYKEIEDLRKKQKELR